jgi:hypothetical protein
VDTEIKTATSDSLDAKVAEKYLNLYVGDVDWAHHIAQVWGRLSKKHQPAEAGAIMKKTLACTILLPLYDRTKIPELPENLLYWVPSYTQFNERDWFALLKETMTHDLEIDNWRNQALSLGIIYPLDYSPVTRQAFKRLYDKAQEAGVINEANKADIVRRFQNLVIAYGGNVICSLFTDKHNYRLKKVLNWRTGYFFEKIIYEVYTIEQVLKIKKAELAKTNPKLVKQIRQD